MEDVYAILSAMVIFARQERVQKYTAMAIYVFCTLVANFFFDTFIDLPIYGKLSVGTIFFAVTFTQRDRVHHYGRNAVYKMIAFAAVANVLMSLTLNVPLRFIFASFLAIVIAETADTEVYQRFIKRQWITRVAASNIVSIPLDSTVFTVIAFAGTFTIATMTEIIAADILAKLVIGFIAAVRVRNVRKHAPLS
jgi:uncharacterized PurR-regulated membrane protein YhhQ (DUF165 family)